MVRSHPIPLYPDHLPQWKMHSNIRNTTRRIFHVKECTKHLEKKIQNLGQSRKQQHHQGNSGTPSVCHMEISIKEQYILESPKLREKIEHHQEQPRIFSIMITQMKKCQTIHSTYYCMMTITPKLIIIVLLVW